MPERYERPVIFEVQCHLCPGLVDQVPQAETGPVGREHLSTVHPLALAEALAEGTGIDTLWQALPAPAVCEACIVLLEPPYWLHIATPPINVAGRQDEDGQWLLCDTCHDLHAAGRAGAWVRHAFTVQTHRAPWVLRLPPDRQVAARAQLAGTIRLMLAHLDQGRRLAAL